MTQPPGATLHLGGDAWAHPALEPLLVPIHAVTPFPGNPRRGDQDSITSSIRDHGLYAGSVTQASTGHIIVGNHRRHALLELGAERIPVTPIDVDDTRAAAIVARDNLTSDQGRNDYGDLLTLLTPLAEESLLELSGYSDRMYANLEALAALPRDFTGQINPDDALRQAGVLDFDNEDREPVFQVKVSFATLSDYEEFRRRLDFTAARRQKTWFPEEPDLMESPIEHVAAEEA